MSAYAAGHNYYKPGMLMSASNACPHKPGGGNNYRRIEWINGFFDAYFQDWCDRHNAGKWGR